MPWFADGMIDSKIWGWASKSGDWRRKKTGDTSIEHQTLVEPGAGCRESLNAPRALETPPLSIGSPTSDLILG